MWACRRAIENRWGLDLAHILWILQSIIHPIFLHGVLVGRKATNKTNHVTKKTKIIRCALIAATGAFKTTPTLALEFLMQVLPIEIKAKQFALNARYRLVRSGFKIYPECGHHKIHTLLSLACDICDQILGQNANDKMPTPKISIPKMLSPQPQNPRSEEHTSELQSPCNLVCRLLLEKKNTHH